MFSCLYGDLAQGGERVWISQVEVRNEREICHLDILNRQYTLTGCIISLLGITVEPECNKGLRD